MVSGRPGMHIHSGVGLSAIVLAVHSLGLVLAVGLSVFYQTEVVYFGNFMVRVDFFGRFILLSHAQVIWLLDHLPDFLCILLD